MCRYFPLLDDCCVLYYGFFNFGNSAKKRKHGELQLLADITNTPTDKRACSSSASRRIKEISKPKAPRGFHVTPPQTTPGDTLNHIVKNCPHIIEAATEKLSALLERNITFALHKAMALQVFGACIKKGMGVLESCDLVSLATGFRQQVVRKWAHSFFAEYFSLLTSVDDTTDEALTRELDSARRKHPKFVFLMADENFRAEIIQYIRENGYVKGAQPYYFEYMFMGKRKL